MAWQCQRGCQFSDPAQCATERQLTRDSVCPCPCHRTIEREPTAVDDPKERKIEPYQFGSMKARPYNF